jgi:hypothetical protein
MECMWLHPATRRQARAVALASALASVAAGACTHSPFEVANNALNGAESQWKRAGYRDYSFRVRRECFCAFTDAVDVVVRGGVPVSATIATSGASADTALMHDFLTIDRLFAYLHAVVATNPVRFDATYHAGLGYPVHVYIDHKLAVADDEMTILVSNVEPAAAR